MINLNKLEDKGWKVGTVSDFLELSPEQAILLEIKLALSRSLQERKQALVTRNEHTESIHSSQLPIAKVENEEESVSIELLISAILSTGASPQDIAQVIASVG
ncbi:MAG: transcriptional regulator [Symploca sp. SIO2D2]|nr:transcriptional regulator [Symploca sp. SIO2D2]